MGEILIENRDFHLLHGLEDFLSHLVEVVLILGDSFQDLIHKLLIILVELSDCFNLSNKIILS